jgi:hypothetical protein
MPHDWAGRRAQPAGCSPRQPTPVLTQTACQVVVARTPAGVEAQQPSVTHGLKPTLALQLLLVLLQCKRRFYYELLHSNSTLTWMKSTFALQLQLVLPSNVLLQCQRADTWIDQSPWPVAG